jgi:hypothetical protein
MLTLTPAAAEAVQQLAANTAVNDETGGLRISSGEPTAQGAALELALVDTPEPADDALDADGAHVFLAPGSRRTWTTRSSTRASSPARSGSRSSIAGPRTTAAHPPEAHVCEPGTWRGRFVMFPA